jgi:aminoglycoside phosphotransferase (APT) family kinase protein
VREADVQWVRAVTGGGAVRDIAPLPGGISSAMHALAIDGRALVLRRIDRQPWLRHAVELLEREAATLRRLAETPVPAPDLVAVEPPRLLMTRLPGAPAMDSQDFDALARTLVAIHAVDARPRTYESWAVGKQPPAWGDAALWRRAIAALDRDPPRYDGYFLHRDFHLGNVLWTEGAVTGVVDWVETSYGPPDLDVAHCCTNLAMTHGPDGPERFRGAYRRAGGTLTDDPYWALLDAVGFLPGQGEPFRGPGPAWDRLEAYVASSLRA